MEAITLLWQRIEVWLAAHAPDLLDEMASGAAEEELIQPDHWVSDDLQKDIAAVFADKRVIAYARQAAAEGDDGRAFIFLGRMLEGNSLQQISFKPWVTTEEQFEICALMIDLYLQRREAEAARIVLAQFVAQAQTRPPEDPVHNTVRNITARVQYEEMKQEFAEMLQRRPEDHLALARTYIASLSPQSRQILEEALAHPSGRQLDALERLWLTAMDEHEQ